MSTLYLINYNNYYNRKVKKEDSISAYAAYLPSGATALSNINFNPNDGINTEQIVNWDYNNPDYVVVVDSNAITSRWFVIEAQRTRAGQLFLTLHRDVIVDNYDEVIEAPIFIEKATLPVSNPLIFNSENMVYNQIKESEELLKDETGCPWLVGYLSSKSTNIQASIDMPAPVDLEIAGISNYTYYNTNIDLINSSKYNIKSYRTGSSYNIYYYWRYDPATNSSSIDTQHFTGNSDTTLFYNNPQNVTQDWINNFVQSFNESASSIASNLSTYLNTSSQSTVLNLLNEEGKVIHDTTTDKYYQVHVVSALQPEAILSISSSIPSLLQNFTTVFNGPAEGTPKVNSRFTYTTVSNAYSITYQIMRYQAQLTEVTAPTTPRTISISDSRYHLTDAPYDMFCIPYSDELKIYKNGTLELTSSKSDAFFGALALMREYSAAGTIYDVQLLPYCPVRYMIQSNGNFDIKSYPVSYITDTNSVKKAVICYASQSSFTFNIANSKEIYRPHDSEYLITPSNVRWTSSSNNARAICNGTTGFVRFNMINTAVKDNEVTNVIGTLSGITYSNLTWVQDGNTLEIDFDTTVDGVQLVGYDIRVYFNIIDEVITYYNSVEVDTKVESETSFYRLCSPNYASSFDFNLAKNQGMDYINIDCSYKPYTPYIHLNPNFKGVYGSDFDDPRGLICGGDFSIPSDSDAWSTFELQNKNYQLAFDRQIESLDLNNSVQGKLDRFNAISGVVTGTVSGAMTGAMAGGVYGAIAGGVLGGAASTIGGAMDVKYNEMLRTDARDLKIDQFNYSLGNIQALPYTLNKVSAFNYNNKIFPILEHYTSTDVERQALINKIKYNGMTVMTIGKISDYIVGDYTYIKGKLIRLENIPDDFHMVNAIADELYKGVYI